VLRYRYDAARIAVDAGDPNTARWLREFVTPWFAVEASPRNDHSVRVTWSESACAELARVAVTAARRTQACFTLDAGPLELPAWRRRGSLVVMDAERDCFYRVTGSDVEVVARPGNPRVRIALLRIVREIATAQAQSRRRILGLHAAAFAVRGRACLVVGPKRSGKTTLLVHALSSGNAALLANDRVLVDATEETGLALGVPAVISLRQGTLDRFPRLRGNASSPRKPLLLHSAELAAARHSNVDDAPADGLALSPPQFTARLGAESVASARLAAFLFPEFDPGVENWVLELLTPEAGADRLRDGLYGGRSRPHEATLFQRAIGSPSAAEPEAIIAQLAPRLPLYRCRLGPDAYRYSARSLLQATLP
jgi:hypothetical protein